MPAVAVVCESFQLLLERDDILYHQAISRTKTLQDSRKKQDDTRSVEDRVDSTCICKMFCW